MYLSKWFRNGAIAVSALFMGGAVLAQDVSVGVVVDGNGIAAQGVAGATVDVAIFFDGNGVARTYQFDITTDLTAIEGGAGGVDTTRCLENAPTLPIQNCVVRTAPNDDTVRVGQASFTDPVPDINPIGVIQYTISATAQPGDMIPLNITDVAVENVDDGDVAQISGMIEVVDLFAVLNVDPAAIDFGNQPTGTTSAPTPVTISNDGTDGIDLEVTDIQLTGDFGNEGNGSCPATPFTLIDGADCTFHVEFSPTADGGANGTLTVVSDAGQVTNDTVDLSGTGIPSDANLAFSAPDGFTSGDTEDYGALDIDADPICVEFVVTNTGVNDTVTGIVSSVGGQPTFSGTGTCGVEGAPGTLAPGASCAATICFNPEAEDNFVGTYDVTSDANTIVANLAGEGTATANIAVNPPFGPVDLGEAGAGETIEANGLISNTGSAAADVACNFTSNPDGVFSANPSPLAANVAANSEVPFSLFCDIPDDADTGDEYTATLECSVDGAVAGTHQLSCAAQNFVAIPVNTLQPWALALLALMMLLAGGVGIRFFRAG
ncbi:MAG: choice-of-anchor D domain-containing protein [Wenzhouxiangella sp.]|jgi:hypothetical protein|nr:choice-of-anchor D domain-containing protein [Wenzhouxiangella sp.]